MIQKLQSALLKIIFRRANLILNLILTKCNIKIDYVLLDYPNPQVIVLISCLGGTLGFILSWLEVVELLASAPMMLVVFFFRNFFQLIQNRPEYGKYKRFFTNGNIQQNLKNILLK